MSITATFLLEVPSLEGVASVDDLELIETVRRWSEVRRIVDAGLARLAGVVAARSSLELGYDGLAQRAGLRTADALTSQLTGTSGAEARTIQAGLGFPTPTVAVDDLADAAHSLLVDSGELPPGKVARLARELRDELDENGVADREAASARSGSFG